MATTQIYWGDGTSDVITVTFSGEVGDSEMTVAASPNMSPNQRTRVINLKSMGGVQIGTLTVTQPAHSREYSAAYNQAYL